MARKEKKNEQITLPHNNMDESHNVGRYKRGCILYSSICIKFKKHTNLICCVRTKNNGLPLMRRERIVIRRGTKMDSRRLESSIS